MLDDEMVRKSERDKMNDPSPPQKKTLENMCILV